MTLTWQDNFSGPPGSPPDPAYWTCCTDGGGGGNNEEEFYTPENAALDGSGLVITAQKDSQYGRPFTSGKIWTKGKLEWRYGHLDVVASFPAIAGAWPAVWMLGASLDEVMWPGCGELDVAEWFGGSPNATDPRADNPLSVSGSMHSATDNPTSVYTLPATADAAALHTYSLDWRPTSLQFSVDGNVYSTLLKKNLASWPFDSPQFLILNLAIGGTMGGTVPAATQFPLLMKVKSVALYNAELTAGG